MKLDQKLIPLKDFRDDHEFWRGTRLRIYNVGQNVNDKNEDYYEYMLAQIPSDNEHFLITNVVGYKSGAAFGLVKISNDSKKVIVKAKALKSTLGLEDTFVVVDEFLT